MDTLNKIAEAIYKVAEYENKMLEKIANKGIFFMPEIAFAYTCGKEIMRSRREIFGTENVRWLREVNLGNGGPSDLVFELNDNKKLVIEFKAAHDHTYYDYHQDIKKLSILKDPNITKVFCALIDTFTSKLPDDGRQRKVTRLQDINVEPIFQKSFPTLQNKYVNEISCVVAVWLVKNKR